VRSMNAADEADPRRVFDEKLGFPFPILSLLYSRKYNAHGLPRVSGMRPGNVEITESYSVLFHASASVFTNLIDAPLRSPLSRCERMATRCFDGKSVAVLKLQPTAASTRANTRCCSRENARAASSRAAFRQREIKRADLPSKAAR